MSFLGLLFEDITPLLVGLKATETHEYFLTLDSEIALVWPSPLSFGKVMFFLNRYSPIIDTTLANLTLQGFGTKGFAPAVSWFFVTGTLWSETILAMRTWAIWGGGRYMFIFLVIFTMAITITEFVLISKFLQSITSLGLTCAPLPKHGEPFPEFLVFMINQAVIAALTLPRAFRQYRSTNSPLWGTMFHDVLAIANLTVALAAPIQWGLFLELPLRVLSSIFSTRVLLNIRGAYFKPSNTTASNDGGARSTNLEFQHPRRQTYSRPTSTSDQISSPTLEAHDAVDANDTYLTYYNEDDIPTAEGRGWIWDGHVDPKPPQLTLRPMTPFEMEMGMTELSHSTPPSP
ncbi:hypothetical protein Clacol_008044 [Clathrus columnatus]|uniref:DUF6533 domain-containing protein n=1 Tax=Clathrus columnatus TaxID=1419009 RepID=A0AAV5AGL0_9AGAM|nr:hypothetical protein Clacol_008044 [Clathrus columnatus]